MAYQSLPEVFVQQVRSLRSAIAIHYFDETANAWRYHSWTQYLDQVKTVAAWLKSQGIGKGDKVGILSANRPEWVIADLAILWVGAVSVPVYMTSPEKDVRYIVEHSEAKIFFVDKPARMKPLAGLGLKSVVCFDAFTPADEHSLNCPCTPMKSVLSTSSSPQEHPLSLRADDLATIIYTSGTTGQPKGVMHSHGNITSGMMVVKQVLEQGRVTRDRFVSFLPLSHVAERMLVEVGSIIMGAEVAFARSVSTLMDDLVRFKPTILLCVPRIWEKIYEKVHISLAHSSPFKKWLFKFALQQGSVRVVGDTALVSRHRKLGALLSDLLVGKALRKKLGLENVRFLITGSAPTRPDVMRFFASFGLYIREVYGLTENFAMGVVNDPDVIFSSCGKVFPTNQIKIAADKEVLFKSDWMFTGYYKNPEATREVLSEDGWFSTGDLGELDNAGNLRIVGRKKELLKTSTGKYVAPVPIEDRLKALPLIQDAMVVGDNQKYCIALVTLDKDACKEKAYQEDLVTHLSEVNRALAHHESIKRIGVLEDGFSVEAGTLTPTLKLKRKAAFDLYEAFIEEIYAAADVIVYQTKA